MLGTSDITLSDYFCGAGGSSTGAVKALKGRGRVVAAANHWQRAIETHNLNHPTVDHYLDDLQATHPSRYPKTTICWMSPECFPAGTLILTERGLKPIEEIQVGERVLTHRGRWMPVIDSMQTVKDTVIVSGQGHRALEVSAEHPFYARRQTQKWNNAKRDYDRRILSDAEWVEARSLTDGEWRWATPVCVEPLGIPLIINRSNPLSNGIERGIAITDLRLWWLVGRWLGDGTVRIRERGHSEITLVCGNHEADALETALSSWRPSDPDKQIGWGELRWRRRQIRTATLFECGNDALAQWLVDNFGKLAHGKHLPAWVLSMPIEFRRALLDGYTSADGHNDGRRTIISTVSKALAVGVRLLVESLGYRASLSTHRRRPSQIEGRTIQVRDTWTVAWENNASQRTGIADNLHAWTLVKDVKPGHAAVTVYNLSVAEDESYVADGIVVHNCTSHSLAKGRQRKNLTQLDLWGDHKVDPAEERSRATMREVVEFTEYHRYEIVVVENVVDIRYWAHYEDWLRAMMNLGYDYRALYLNAMFFDVPQSRDRIYIVFWKRGNRAPDLDFRPPAFCAEHGQVNAVQVWKKVGSPWGRYGKNRQYTYRCPKCGTEVKPYYRPAASVIDWSIPSQRIGDRDKPLKPKTMERIKAGLRKFARPVMIDVAYGGQPGYVYPVDEAMPTQTTRQTFALVEPFMLNYVNNDSRPRGVDEPMQTVGTRNTPPLVVPPFLVNYYTREDAQSGIDQPMGTLTTEKRHALVIPPYIAELHGTSTVRDVNEPMMGITSGGMHHALITPPMITSVNYFDDITRSVDQPMPTQTTANKTALVIPPFLAVMKNSWSPDGSYIMPPRELDEPLTTVVASASQHALITPFITTYNKHSVYVDVNGVLPTIPTLDRHALVECDATAFDPADLIDACGFRMLEPEELKLGMSFPKEYVITGNKREQVRQVGNAVACNVAEWIVERCVESLQ